MLKFTNDKEIVINLDNTVACCIFFYALSPENFKRVDLIKHINYNLHYDPQLIDKLVRRLSVLLFAKSTLI